MKKPDAIPDYKESCVRFFPFHCGFFATNIIQNVYVFSKNIINSMFDLKKNSR